MFKVGSRDESRPFDVPAAGPASWRAGLRRVPWLTLGVIAAGGALGALARQGLSVALPHRPGTFDWTTLGINVAGCGVIGALMTAVTEVRHVHRLTSPFLGVGVLGGFTTFSTYIVEAQQSITAGKPAAGLAYLAGTLATALLAVYAGAAVTRLLARWHHRERS
jgi:CrcB protein